MIGQERCEFYVIRYYADPIRDEAVNIGIVLLSLGNDSGHLPVVRFTRNWNRVRRIDPNADIEVLSEMEASFHKIIREAGQAARSELDKLEKSLSNLIRLARMNEVSSVKVSPGKITLTDSYEDEVNRLMTLYVEDRE